MKRPLFWIGLVLLCAVWIFYNMTGFAAAAVAAVALGAFMLLCAKNTRISLALFLCTTLLGALLARYDVSHHSIRLQRMVNQSVEAVITLTQLQPVGGRVLAEGIADIFIDEKIADNMQVTLFLAADTLPANACNIRVRGIAMPSEHSFYSKQIVLRDVVLLKTETAAADSFTALCVRLQGLLTRAIFSSNYGQTPTLLAALLVGNTTHISPQLRSSLSAAGLSHLIAVSGLHLSVFMQLADRCAGQERKLLRTITQLLCCWGFAAITGLSVSVRRAALMYTLMILAGLFSRKNDSLTSLGAAVTLILLFDPTAALSYAMWLSASATGGILLLTAPVERALTCKGSGTLCALYNRFCTVISVTIAAQIASLPILILMNSSFSVWSIVANIPAVSLVGVLLPLGYLSLLPFVSLLLAPLVRLLSLLLIRIAVLFEQIRWGQFFLNEYYQVIWLVGTYLLLVTLARHQAKKTDWCKALSLSAASLATLFFCHQLMFSNTTQLLFNSSKTLLAVVRFDRAVVVGVAEKRQDYEQMAQALSRLGVGTIDCAILGTGQAPDKYMNELMTWFDCNRIYTLESHQSKHALKGSDHSVYFATQPEFYPLGVRAQMEENCILFYFRDITLLKFPGRCDILTTKEQYRLLSEQGIARYRFFLSKERTTNDGATAEEGAFTGERRGGLFAMR